MRQDTNNNHFKKNPHAVAKFKKMVKHRFNKNNNNSNVNAYVTPL